MDLTQTLAAAAFALAAAVFCGWRGARPPDLSRGPRMIPWQWLMLVSGAAVALMLVHLVNLLGLAPPAL